MKRTKLIWISAALALLLACGSLLTVFAEGNGEAAPADESAYDLWIYGKNLAMEDSVYIYYAVPVEGTNGADVKMLFWLEPQDSYTYGTQQFELSPERDTMDIHGETCYIFNFKELAAKHMTVDVYAKVYVEDENGAHYSELDKYSVLQYCYNMLGKTSSYVPKPELEELLNAMLDYGAMAQKYFKTNTDRLANAEYYQVTLNGALLPDGSNSGLYAKGTELTVTVPLTDASGANFSHWEDSKGNKVEATVPDKLVVGDKNEVYTPVYVKYSAGLEFESNEDGTCCLLSMGDCTDTDLIIPPTALDGDKVTGIDSNAFAGEAITSVSFPSTIEEIGRRAFNNCTSLTDVYYDGTEEEWSEISISAGNDAILNATKHFKSPAVETFTVTFVDHDGTVLKTESVESGKSATAPAAPEREGYTFTGWDKSFDTVTEDMTVTATYSQVASSKTYTVTFYDYDGTTILGTSNVAEGKTATLPANPSKAGANFLGWNGNFTNVRQNESVVAVYDDSKNIFTVESATGNIGDNVTLLVSIDGKVKTCGFDITIYYDNVILELVTYDSDLDLDVVVNTEYLDNGVLLNFSAATEKTKSREIIELTFRIKDTTADATSVYVEMTSVKEMDGSTIIDSTCEFVEGVVTIQ